MAPKRKNPRAGAVVPRFDPDRLEEFRAETAQSHKDAETMFTAINEQLRKFRTLSAWLQSLTNSPEAANDYASKLYETFPPPIGHAYNDGQWKDGLTTVHLYNLGFDEHLDGYSIPSSDDYLLMICLILARGFQTDPAVPGVEAISILPSKSALSKSSLALHYKERPVNPMLHIGSCGYVKGKKRAGSALAIANAIIALNYDVQTQWPSLWQSLRVVHCLSLIHI